MRKQRLLYYFFVSKNMNSLMYLSDKGLNFCPCPFHVEWNNNSARTHITNTPPLCLRTNNTAQEENCFYKQQYQDMHQLTYVLFIYYSSFR